MTISNLILNRIYSTLFNLGYVKKITDLTYLFHDEPKIYSYSVALKGISEAKRLSSQLLGGAGISFFSRKLALLKSLMEAAERVSAVRVDIRKSHNATFEEIKIAAVNPSQYLPQYSPKSKLYWMKGQEIIKDVDAYIPTQLLHLTYPFVDKNEPVLGYPNTSGEAAGFDIESATVRGLYELIERDALMTTHLLTHKAPLLDLSTIRNKQITQILSVFRKYNLMVRVFDITNDLQIPSYLAMLTDNTGIGLPVTFGYRSNLNSLKAIIGSIEETLLGRTGVRIISYQATKYKPGVTLLSKRDSIMERLTYLTNQESVLPQFTYSKLSEDMKEELETVKKRLSRAGLSIYRADITYPPLSDIGIKVVKVIVPKMQPYIFNNNRVLRMERLKRAAIFYKYDSFVINSIPHPFDEKL